MRILRTWLEEPSWRIAVIGLLIASLLAPVIVMNDFYFPYVVPRNLFFRAVIEVTTTILVVALSLGRKRLDLRGEPIFWSLTAFLVAILLSALVSPARMHSLFGDFERMGGVWAWLHFVLFFLLLRTLRDEDWRWILNSAVAIGLFVSLRAILSQLGLPGSDTVTAPSVSTIGNSGLLAGYLLFCVAIAGFLATERGRFRLLYLSAGAINLLALSYAQNRSTLVGLVLGAIVGTATYAVVAAPSRKKWVALAVASGSAVIVFALAATVRFFPGSQIARHVPVVVERLALSNPAGSDESRTIQWRAAIAGFRERPLLGYGIENHNLAWSEHFDPGIYRLDTDVYDRTHNQYVETLATSGVVGALAFLAIWIAIGMTLVRAFRAGRISAASTAVLWGIQIAYATFLFFWFFDLNSTMLWILVGALIASRATVGPIVLEATATDPHPASSKPMLALAAMTALVAVVFWEGYSPFIADRALARLDSSRATVSAKLASVEFLARSPAHQTAHTPLEMASFLASLRPSYGTIRKHPLERAAMDRAFNASFAAFAREIQRDKLNDRLYTHEAGLYADAAEFYESDFYRQKAIAAFHTAIDLSPRRTEQSIGLAQLYMTARDYERAIVVLCDVVAADPLLGEPRYRLAAAYIGAGKTDSALTMLQKSLNLGYVGAPEVYVALGRRLEFAGRNVTAASLYSSYLEAKYTQAVWDGTETIDGPIPFSDLAVAAHLPLLYMRARESELAIKSAAALSAFDPSRTSIVDRFVSDVGARRRANWVARSSLLPCPAARKARGSDSTALNACGVFRRKL